MAETTRTTETEPADTEPAGTERRNETNGGPDSAERFGPSPREPRVDPEVDVEGDVEVDVDEADSALGGEEPAGGERHLCSVAFCPVGMALSTVQQAKPDAVEHLLAAGREFLLAAKAVLDQRAEDLDGSSKLEKIDIG